MFRFHQVRTSVGRPARPKMHASSSGSWRFPVAALTPPARGQATRRRALRARPAPATRRRPHIVVRHALTLVRHQSEVQLSGGISLIGRPAKPCQCLALSATPHLTLVSSCPAQHRIEVSQCGWVQSVIRVVAAPSGVTDLLRSGVVFVYTFDPSSSSRVLQDDKLTTALKLNRSAL